MSTRDERIDAWIAALRSGKYVQTTGALTKVNDDDDEEDCCLGVACKLAGVERERFASLFHYGSDRIDTDDESSSYGKLSETSSIDLPRDVMEWLNVYDNTGAIKHPFMHQRFKHDGAEYVLTPSSVRCLANLNDDGFSFAQIADIIDFFRDCL